MKKIFLILFLIGLLPLISQGAGLVPCGGPNENPCTVCDLLVLLQNILHFALEMAFLIVIIFAIYGGFLWIFSGGKEANIKAGQQAITNAIIGLIIILSAWLIVNTFFWIVKLIGGEDYTGTWFKIECSSSQNSINNTGTSNSNGNGGNGSNGSNSSGSSYQYGDACRLQTVPPYDCHKEENCCYNSTDCDLPGVNKGQFDCPDGWVCCVAKRGITEPPLPPPPTPNPQGPCKDGKLMTYCSNYSICREYPSCVHKDPLWLQKHPDNPKYYCSKGGIMTCPESCVHQCDRDEECNNK